MIEVEATKKLFEAIKRGVNEILSRDGKKLLCDHGICLEVADILGLAVRSSLPFIHFHKGGYVICDVVSLVIEKLGIELDDGTDLIYPSGKWGETRWRLCRELLTKLNEESFIEEFLESKYCNEINLELFDKYYDELC